MFWSLPPQSRTEFISLCRKSKNAFMSNERHSATRITVKGNLPLQTKKWKVRGSLKEPQEVSIQGEGILDTVDSFCNAFLRWSGGPWQI